MGIDDRDDYLYEMRDGSAEDREAKIDKAAEAAKNVFVKSFRENLSGNNKLGFPGILKYLIQLIQLEEEGYNQSSIYPLFELAKAILEVKNNEEAAEIALIFKQFEELLEEYRGYKAFKFPNGTIVEFLVRGEKIDITVDGIGYRFTHVNRLKTDDDSGDLDLNRYSEKANKLIGYLKHILSATDFEIFEKTLRCTENSDYMNEQEIGMVVNVLKSALMVDISAITDYDADYSIKTASAMVLAKIGEKWPKMAVPALVEALCDNHILRDTAVSYSAKIGEIHPDAVVPILADYLRNENLGIRSIAASVLQEMGENHTDMVLPVLIEAMGDENPSARLAALSGLGEFLVPIREILDMLIRLTKDEQDSIRVAAIEALCKIDFMDYSDIVVPVLIEALRGDIFYPSIRWRAIDALAKYQNRAKDILPHLIPFLNDTDQRIKQAALRTIGKIGVKNCADMVTDPLLLVLDDPDIENKCMAAYYLAKIDSIYINEKTLPILFKALSINAGGNMTPDSLSVARIAVATLALVEKEEIKDQIIGWIYAFLEKENWSSEEINAINLLFVLMETDDFVVTIVLLELENSNQYNQIKKDLAKWEQAFMYLQDRILENDKTTSYFQQETEDGFIGDV